VQLVLSTCPFETNRLAGLVAVIRDAGFTHLEVMDKPEFETETNLLDELSARSRSCGIEIPNWHLLTDCPLKETDDARRGAIERTKRSMERGLRLGARNHVLHWQHRFEDRSLDDLWRSVVDEWVEHARKLGVRLLMETVPDKPSNERYVWTSQIADFVRNYPDRVMSICLDVNHSNLRENLTDAVRTAGDRLASLHISDNDGRFEKHWLPGQGVIDYPALFDSLEAVRFDGTVVLEVEPWCDQPASRAELERLYLCAKTLLETGRPHPETPRLADGRGP